MNGWWRGTRLVAGRAMTETVRSRSFRVVTLILLLIGTAGVVLPQVLGGDDGTRRLATVGPAPAGLVESLDVTTAGSGLEVEYVEVDSEDAARQAVEDGDADAALVGDTLYAGSDLTATFPGTVAQAVTALETAQRLADAGLSPQQVAELQQVSPPELVRVGGAEDADRAGAGFLVGIVLYLAVTFAGSAIATSVATEKASRISEVLLPVLRSSQILVGTVLAVGLTTLAQLLVLLTPVAVGVRVTEEIGLPEAAAADLALGVVWFVLGFVMFAFVFAAAGAMVDKVQDVGGTIAPISIILIAGYMLGVVFAAQDGDGPVAVAASIVPVTAPLVMPIRWAAGTVPVWQLVLAMVLTAATAVLLAAFASRVYRRALLITGRRARWREVLGRSAPA